jgi:hypothetical protein
MAQLFHVFYLIRQFIDLFRDPYISHVQHLNRCYVKPAVPGVGNARRKNHGL